MNKSDVYLLLSTTEKRDHFYLHGAWNTMAAARTFYEGISKEKKSKSTFFISAALGERSLDAWNADIGKVRDYGSAVESVKV